MGKSVGNRAKTQNRGGEVAASPVVKPQTTRHAHALLLAALIGVTFCAYSNSFEAPFLVDNDPIVLKDPRIRTATSLQIHRVLTGPYWPLAAAGLYRPLTTLSYLFNYAVLGNGTNPAGYHWFNLILHSINIALVYALGLVIFEQIPAAFALAGMWGLHPILTESVTNIVGRADLLAAFGVLAALLSHRNSLRTSRGCKAVWLVAVTLAVTAGMFSKESAIVVVAVIALYDFTFGRTVSWRSRVPSYIAVIVPCLVFLFVRVNVLAHAAATQFLFAENPLLSAGFWTARMTAVKVIGKYLGLLVWPARLSFDYSYNEIPVFGWGLTNWEDWKAVAGLIVCAAAAVVAIRSFRRNKPVFFFIAFFFATLSPTSNLVILIGSIMGERFLYLPSVGFAALVVCAFQAVSQRLHPWQSGYRYVSATALTVILFAFATRTYSRNADWLDRGRFWRSALEAAPGSYKTNIAAAENRVVFTQKDWDSTVGEVGRALAILGSLPDVQNAGIVYRQAGAVYRNLGDKVASSKAAAGASAATSPEYWYRKSLSALLRSEQIELAQDERTRPENERRGAPLLSWAPGALYRELARTYLRLADSPHALEAFERGRVLESDPDLLEELASAYQAAGDLRKAAIALVEALAVDSSRVQITSKLVELYAGIDPGGCAVSRRDGTPSLNLDCPLVHGDICMASRNVFASYRRTGQHFQAAAIRRIAEADLGCAPALLN
jgi:tetratricopeptide (TPR) repeat protein